MIDRADMLHRTNARPRDVALGDGEMARDGGRGTMTAAPRWLTAADAADRRQPEVNER